MMKMNLFTTYTKLFSIVLSLVLCLTASPWASAMPEATGNRIVINIPSLRLYVFSGEEVIRTYPVGLGKNRFPTPEGEFEVISKVVDPAWENPFSRAGSGRARIGANSPLGTRWIGFLEANGGEYGIHGTNEPASVGKFSSHGCVRMYINDAEELFTLVDFSTPVQVTYELVEFHKSNTNNEIQVSVYPDVFGRGYPSAGKLWTQIKGRFPNATINEDGLAQVLNQRIKQRVTTTVAKNVPLPDEEGGEAQIFKIRISN